MPPAPSMRDVQHRLLLQAKLEAVATARGDERIALGRSGTSSIEVNRLRWLTLEALEEYAGSLDELSWPVPREILQDIRLRRALLSLPLREH